VKPSRRHHKTDNKVCAEPTGGRAEHATVVATTPFRRRAFAVVHRLLLTANYARDGSFVRWISDPGVDAMNRGNDDERLQQKQTSKRAQTDGASINGASINRGSSTRGNHGVGTYRDKSRSVKETRCVDAAGRTGRVGEFSTQAAKKFCVGRSAFRRRRIRDVEASSQSCVRA
jgi:hypothetical protein